MESLEKTKKHKNDKLTVIVGGSRFSGDFLGGLTDVPYLRIADNLTLFKVCQDVTVRFDGNC